LLEQVAESVYQLLVVGKVLVSGKVKHGVDNFVRPNLLTV
jgi:hypothetical protein